MTLMQPVETTVNGRRLSVVPHFAAIDGRMVCVGLDFRSLAGDPVEITTPIIRAVRASEIIQAASKAIAAALPPPTPGEPLPRKRTRGRRPSLTDEALRDVVAPAYLRAARGSTAAVQRVLEDAGLHRPATADLARKAIQRARRRGFIPPVSSNA